MTRKIVFPLAVFALFVAVILQNSKPVMVNFLFWDAEVPLVVLLIGWSFGGFLCGAVFTAIVMREKKKPAEPPLPR